MLRKGSGRLVFVIFHGLGVLDDVFVVHIIVHVIVIQLFPFHFVPDSCMQMLATSHPQMRKLLVVDCRHIHGEQGC